MAATTLATAEDYAARYGTPTDTERVTLLLADASALLLSAYEGFWGEEHAEGAHDAFDRAAAAVCCRLVHNALAAPEGFEGATQFSQGAGGYSASVTFGGALGDMWLSKTDRELLGLAGQRMGVILPIVGGEVTE